MWMDYKFNGSEKIGDIVTMFPGASNLLKAHGIDFCCGGNRPLLTALRQQGTDAEQFLAQLNASREEEAKRLGDPGVNWREVSFSGLIDHVVGTHHAFLLRELPVLSEFTTKIYHVHGPKQGDTLQKLHKLFHEMKGELEQHLAAEEEIVFPLIKRYEESPSEELLSHVVHEINTLEADHSSVGDILKEMRSVTNGYELPEWACRTYTLTFQKLEDLESDIFQHIHLENNILFPRVLEDL